MKNKSYPFLVQPSKKKLSTISFQFCTRLVSVFMEEVGGFAIVFGMVEEVVEDG
ncbi:uncharacterized protein METZ01_LOCUS449523, partial [marine metagenome]